MDLAAVKAIFNATYVSFASPDIAEGLAQSVAGTVLVVDPSLLENDELYRGNRRTSRIFRHNVRIRFVEGIPQALGGAPPRWPQVELPNPVRR